MASLPDKGLMFPEKRYLQKRKKLGEIIKLFNMPPFIPKKSENNDTSRIEIVYDTYLEVSIKDSTRIARAKEEPIEIITFPPVIKKNWTLSVSKKHLQIFSRNYFLIKRKEKGKNIILSC